MEQGCGGGTSPCSNLLYGQRARVTRHQSPHHPHITQYAQSTRPSGFFDARYLHLLRHSSIGSRSPLGLDLFGTTATVRLVKSIARLGRRHTIQRCGPAFTAFDAGTAHAPGLGCQRREGPASAATGGIHVPSAADEGITSIAGTSAEHATVAKTSRTEPRADEQRGSLRWVWPQSEQGQICPRGHQRGEYQRHY